MPRSENIVKNSIKLSESINCGSVTPVRAGRTLLTSQQS